MPDIRGFLNRSGVMLTVERNGVQVGAEKGLINREQSTQKRYIGFIPGTKIDVGDWLVNPSGDRFYVYDKETMSVSGRPYQLKCYVQSETEFKTKETLSSNTVFNIGTATGSVIGTQSVVNFNYANTVQQLKEQLSSTDSPDKADLEKVTDILEMVLNNQLPPQKGMFSKFADILQRNSWFTNPMMSALLGWLTSQIL